MFYLTEVNDTTIAPSSQMIHSLNFFEESWYEKFMLLSSFHCDKFFNGQKVASLQRM